jgi:hypothetical protein
VTRIQEANVSEGYKKHHTPAVDVHEKGFSNELQSTEGTAQHQPQQQFKLRKDEKTG